MEEFKGNSHREKAKLLEEKEKLEPVVSGKSMLKKNGFFKTVLKSVIASDAENIRDYVLFDVVIPMIKNIVVDSVSNGVSMLVYGAKRGAKRRDEPAYIKYQDSGRGGRDEDRLDRKYSRQSVYDYGNILFETRSDAERVLDGLFSKINDYHIASVADMYELANIRDDNYMNYKYGWTDIESARIVFTRGRYMIEMPKALPLD